MTDLITDQDDVHHARQEHGLRFDGTITAGNLLTATAMMVALAVWGVRLEGRVDHETDLRARLEATVNQTTRDLKDTASANMLQLQTTMRENDTELKASLRRIDDKLDAVLSAQMPRHTP